MNSCVVLAASAFLLGLLYDSKNAEDESSTFLRNIMLSSDCKALQKRRPYSSYFILFTILKLHSNTSFK
jgi:hypothetical protein